LPLMKKECLARPLAHEIIKKAWNIEYHFVKLRIGELTSGHRDTAIEWYLS
jgi:hypothetical protein